MFDLFRKNLYFLFYNRDDPHWLMIMIFYSDIKGKIVFYGTGK